MSVAEFASRIADTGSASVAMAAIAITSLAVRAGFRWVSEPELSPQARRLVRGVVFTGWALLLGLVIGVGVLVLISGRQVGPATSERESPRVMPLNLELEQLLELDSISLHKAFDRSLMFPFLFPTCRNRA